MPLSSPYSSGCLSPAGDGLQPAISDPSFVLCAVVAVSCVRAFRVVAIPQSGLLAQVRSFWLRVGRSCPILTKHCSLPRVPALPPLPSAGCRRLFCFSIGGVTVGLVIGFNYLFIFPSCYVALCASKARHRLSCENVSWCLETSLFKSLFLGWDSLPRTELPPYLLCLFFHPLYFFLPVFEANDLLCWIIRMVYLALELIDSLLEFGFSVGTEAFG